MFETPYETHTRCFSFLPGSYQPSRGTSTSRPLRVWLSIPCMICGIWGGHPPLCPSLWTLPSVSVGVLSSFCLLLGRGFVNPHRPRSLAYLCRFRQPRVRTIVPDLNRFFSIDVSDCSSPNFRKGFGRVPYKGVAKRPRSNPLLESGHHDIFVMGLKCYGESP